LFFAHTLLWAYEDDVHYHLTKYLAKWAGFSVGEAEQIAASDQELDSKPEFGALPVDWGTWSFWKVCPGLLDEVMSGRAFRTGATRCPEYQRMLTTQRAYHFVDGNRLNELRSSAFRNRNLKALGHYGFGPRCVEIRIFGIHA
jgi:hypothetical protein